MDSAKALRQSLGRFIDEAVDLRTTLAADGSNPTVEEFANNLANLPAIPDVSRAAGAAAKDNSYLVRKKRAGEAPRPAGRALTAATLLDTGTAGLLLAGEGARESLMKELAEYLAGPPIPIWEYAIIDADVELREPIKVVDGWQLVAPSIEELSSLMGVPSGARYLEKPPFSLELLSGLAMIRRIVPEARAVSGWLWNFDFRPTHTLWRPLLALSLYQNPVIQLWAKYNVEPGRRVHRLFDRVYTEPWTPDGVTEIERVVLGDFRVEDANENEFRRFLLALNPLLETAAPQSGGSTKRQKRQAARVRRVAEHFLTAAESAHGEGEVLSEFNADAVLHYVIALEAVLTGDDSEKSELTRKVVQRAAVLAGTDDEDRTSVANIIRSAYAARSSYAHGSEPDAIDLPQLRRVVRKCILGRLILGDPTPDGLKLAELVDLALLSQTCLENNVRGPIQSFWQAIEA